MADNPIEDKYLHRDVHPDDTPSSAAYKAPFGKARHANEKDAEAGVDDPLTRKQEANDPRGADTWMYTD